MKDGIIKKEIVVEKEGVEKMKEEKKREKGEKF